MKVKKVISMLLIAIMIIQLIPFNSFADEEDDICIVKLLANGGTILDVNDEQYEEYSIVCHKGDNIKELLSDIKQITKDGFTHIGWIDVETSEFYSRLFMEIIINGDMCLQAKWKEGDLIACQFNANGGYFQAWNSEDGRFIEKGLNIYPEIPFMKDSDKVFSGWRDADTSEFYEAIGRSDRHEYSPELKANKDMNLNAEYGYVYNLYYDFNGGESVDPSEAGTDYVVFQGDSVKCAYPDSKFISKDGYILAGWVEINNTESILSEDELSVMIPSRDMSFTAVWEKDVRPLELDSIDITEEMDVGDISFIYATYNRELMEGDTVEWVCDNPDVLSVSGNKMTALQPGNAVLHIYLNGNRWPYDFDVNVYGKRDTPDVPHIKTFGSTEIEVVTEAGILYSLDKTNWQMNSLFDELEPDTDYYVYAKRIEGGYYHESDISEPLRVHTNRISDKVIINSGLSGDLNWSIDEDGLLRIWGAGDYRRSASVKEPVWTAYSDDIKGAYVNVVSLVTANSMFAGCKYMEGIEIYSLNTSSVSDMSLMFNSCNALRSVNFEGIDTANVTDMSNMFGSCTTLDRVDMSDNDTSNVLKTNGMFNACTNLKSIKLGSLENASNMNSMFKECGALEHVEFSDASEISNASNLRNMFYNCGTISEIDMSSFRISSACNVDGLFFGCNSLRKLIAPTNVEEDLELLPISDEYCWLDETGKDVNNTVLKSTTVKQYFRDNKTSNELVLLNVVGLPQEVSVTVPGYGIHSSFNRTIYDNDSLEWIVDDPDMLHIVNTGYDNNNWFSTVYPGEKPGETTVSCSINGKISDTKYTVKVYGKYDKPAAPSIKSITSEVIEVDAEVGMLYSLDKETWQSEGVFEWLDQDTSYDVYAKKDANGYYRESDVSNPVRVRTKASSIIQSGISGDLNWSINEDGLLKIWGTGDYTRYTYESPIDNVISLNAEWLRYSDLIKSAAVNVRGITSTKGMFYGCKMIKSINLDKLDTSDVTDMSEMFYGCCSIEKLNLENLDTFKVTDMNLMFSGCSLLTDLDVSKFDTSNVVSMVAMFGGCGFSSIDLNGFNTSNVTNMAGMFCLCENLKYLDLRNFNTEKVKSMANMFTGCKSLSQLDISSFMTSQIELIKQMFWGCDMLEKIDMSGFDLTNLTYYYSLFQNCNSLKEIKAPKVVPYDMNALPLSDSAYQWVDENGVKAEKIYKADYSKTYRLVLIPLEITSYGDVPTELDVGTSGSFDITFNRNIQDSEKFEWVIDDEDVVSINSEFTENGAHCTLNALMGGTTELRYSIDDSTPQTVCIITSYAPQDRPDAPTIKSYEAGSFEVVPEEGVLYSLDKENWQTEPVFDGLYADTDYKVYAKRPAHEFYKESEISKPTGVHTKDLEIIKMTEIPKAMELEDELKIDIELNAKPPKGKELKWEVYNESILEISEDNVITAKNEGITGVHYTVGNISKSFNIRIYELLPKPVEPEFMGITDNSITVLTRTGYSYSLDGENWSNSSTSYDGGSTWVYKFSDLEPDTDYVLYSGMWQDEIFFISETTVHTKLPELKVTDISGIKNSMNVGDRIEVSVSFNRSLEDDDSFEWVIADSEVVSVSEDNVITALSPGKTDISYCVNGIVNERKYNVEVYGKAETPAAPVIEEVTDDSIKILTVENGQYSLDCEEWQEKGIFTGLEADKDYVVYARLKAHGYYLESAISEGTKVRTKVKEPEVWPFKDVAEDSALAREVKLAYDKDIISGYGEPDENGQVNFKPAKYVTRAQFAIMVYNLAGRPDMGNLANAKGYTDVPVGSTGHDEILWASSKGIISGFSNGTFKPDREVGRAQMAIMLKKYADYRGYGDMYASGGIDIWSFSDSDKIKKGSEESLQWAVNQGILSGKGRNMLDPNGTARRDQCAAVFARFYDRFE
ncbi:MAG: BspA family leucine-rich repeat surface protein [Eubacterium sp.]|nr:BspA family leucine-rich repeat surface protein [Eubacterium sp.]